MAETDKKYAAEELANKFKELFEKPDIVGKPANLRVSAADLMKSGQALKTDKTVIFIDMEIKPETRLSNHEEGKLFERIKEIIRLNELVKPEKLDNLSFRFIEGGGIKISLYERDLNKEKLMAVDSLLTPPPEPEIAPEPVKPLAETTASTQPILDSDPSLLRPRNEPQPDARSLPRRILTSWKTYAATAVAVVGLSAALKPRPIDPKVDPYTGLIDQYYIDESTQNIRMRAIESLFDGDLEGMQKEMGKEAGSGFSYTTPLKHRSVKGEMIAITGEGTFEGGKNPEDKTISNFVRVTAKNVTLRFITDDGEPRLELVSEDGKTSSVPLQKQQHIDLQPDTKMEFSGQESEKLKVNILIPPENHKTNTPSLFNIAINNGGKNSPELAPYSILDGRVEAQTIGFSLPENGNYAGRLTYHPKIHYGTFQGVIFTCQSKELPEYRKYDSLGEMLATGKSFYDFRNDLRADIIKKLPEMLPEPFVDTDNSFEGNFRHYQKGGEHVTLLMNNDKVAGIIFDNLLEAPPVFQVEGNRSMTIRTPSQNPNKSFGIIMYENIPITIKSDPKDHNNNQVEFHLGGGKTAKINSLDRNIRISHPDLSKVIETPPIAVERKGADNQRKAQLAPGNNVSWADNPKNQPFRRNFRDFIR